MRQALTGLTSTTVRLLAAAIVAVFVVGGLLLAERTGPSAEVQLDRTETISHPGHGNGNGHGHGRPDGNADHPGNRDNRHDRHCNDGRGRDGEKNPHCRGPS